MPKKLRRLPAKYIQPELRACIAAAGRAVGKKSPLMDGDIQFLAELALDNIGTLAPGLLCDEDGVYPTLKAHELNVKQSKKLAWIFYRDPAGASKAILSAQKEMGRMMLTNIWPVRRALRLMCCTDPLFPKKKPLWDIQRISEYVKKEYKLNVSDKLIHKAIRLEEKEHFKD